MYGERPEGLFKKVPLDSPKTFHKKALKVFEIPKNFANFAAGKFAPSEARMFAKISLVGHGAMPHEKAP